MAKKNTKAPGGDEYVKICPKCGSIDISSSGFNPISNINSSYTCNRCGFTAAMFPEAKVDELEEIDRDIKDSGAEIKAKPAAPSRIDPGYINVYLTIAKFVGPTIILAALYAIYTAAQAGITLPAGVFYLFLGAGISYLGWKKK